jgi:hypothetical protein
MTTVAKRSQIKKSVESKLVEMLKKGGEGPKKEDLQVLSIAVKYLAVEAKLNEAEWGSDLSGLTEPDPENEGED